MNATTFIVQPGGKFREALDGGLILPMHLDASFATEFLEVWRTEGISFALCPLREIGAEAPETSGASAGASPQPGGDNPPRHLTPAQKLRLFCHEEGLNYDDIKAELGRESLADLPMGTVNAIKIYLHGGKPIGGLHEYLDKRGML